MVSVPNPLIATLVDAPADVEDQPVKQQKPWSGGPFFPVDQQEEGIRSENASNMQVRTKKGENNPATAFRNALESHDFRKERTHQSGNFHESTRHATVDEKRWKFIFSIEESGRKSAI